MSRTDDTARGPWGAPAEDDELRRLLTDAGPRPELPADDLDQIRRAAHAAWQRRYAASPPAGRSPAPWLALAAAVAAAAIGLALWWGLRTPTPTTGTLAASVEVVDGVVRVREAEGQGELELPAAARGRTLYPGSTVQTAAAAATDAGTDAGGRLALRMAGGASLRIAAGSRLEIVSAGRVELLRGAVYVDTGGPGAGNDEVAVATAAGLFESVGTQFEVRTADGRGAAVRLRVREGSVMLGRDGERLAAAAGEELLVAADGSVARRPLPPYGPEWAWVVATAPRLDIEGATVRRFLDWVGRETGWRVQLAPAAAAVADSVILHGSIDHLSPEQAPAAVLPSGGFDHRLTDDGTLVVSLAD